MYIFILLNGGVIMKKTGRILMALVLCTLFVFSLTGCNRKQLETFNEKAPVEMYNLSLESAAEMTNYEIEHVQKITGKAFMFIKKTETNTITIKVDGDNFYQNMESTAEAYLPENSVLECWCVDNMFYAVHPIAGKFIKQACYPEDILSGAYDFKNLDDVLLELSEEKLISTSFYKERKDVYLEIVMNGDEYYRMVFASGMTGAGFAGNAKGDVTYRVYFHDDGTIDRVYTYFEFAVESNGITVDMEFEQVSTIKNIGGTTVNLPAEAASAEFSSYYIFQFR